MLHHHDVISALTMIKVLNGKIRCSYFNAPGVLHKNSTMAIWSYIYDQIVTVNSATGKKVVVDFSEFASKSLVQ